MKTQLLKGSGHFLSYAKNKLLSYLSFSIAIHARIALILNNVIVWSMDILGLKLCLVPNLCNLTINLNNIDKKKKKKITHSVSTPLQVFLRTDSLWNFMGRWKQSKSSPTLMVGLMTFNPLLTTRVSRFTLTEIIQTWISILELVVLHWEIIQTWISKDIPEFWWELLLHG